MLYSDSAWAEQSSSSGRSPRPRSTTRPTSASSTPWSATETSATRSRAASRSSSATATRSSSTTPAASSRKSAIVLTKRIGGTSGPIWGTAFLRAGATLGDHAGRAGGGPDRDAARRDRRDQAARPGRPRRQDAARRARSGGGQLERRSARRRRTRWPAPPRTGREAAEATRACSPRAGARATPASAASRLRRRGSDRRGGDLEEVSKAWQELDSSGPDRLRPLGRGEHQRGDA